MSRKYGTFSSDFLTAIGEATGFFTWPIPYTESWRKQQMKRKGSSSKTLHHFKKQGWVEEQKKERKNNFSFNSKGQLGTVG